MTQSSVRLSARFATAVALILSSNCLLAQDKGAEHAGYSHATNGILHTPYMKLLLDESNLGGKELEIVEFTLRAGTVSERHKHESVEVLYVLSGVLDHEVNGESQRLTAGMIGIVRPEDTVRHIVPKDADARVLVIWTPAGEAQRAGINPPRRCTGLQVAMYKGSGDRKAAQSYVCKEP